MPLFYDISVPIREEMPVYPGDAGVRIIPLATVGPDSPFALSKLELGSHTGTHLDPPAHFFPGGLSVDRVPLETLIGPAHVVDMPDGPAVTAGFLESQALPPRVERILFKTGNGALWDVPRFRRRFVYVDESAARWLVDRGARLVGIDYLSAEQYGARRAVTHLALLGAGAVILEGIDLRRVPPGEYTLVCLPLKLEGGDGAPSRAVLIKGWETA